MVLPNKKGYVILANVCRVLLSLVLIVSGFVKAVDPIGSMYKMGEYAAAFSFENLSSDWLMFFAVSQAAVEFMLGVFILVGVYRRFTTAVTPALMLFFTKLTAFIYASDNIDDCGCFGEAVTMSNGETLLKNVVLLVLSLPLFFGRKLLVARVSARCRWMVTIFSLFYIGAVMIISFNHLPVIDFGDYAVGTDLRSLTQGTPDKYNVIYVYERGNERCELPEGELPDSTWTCVSSRAELAEKGTEPAVKDFLVYDWEYDYDATEEILADTGYVCLVLVEKMESASLSRVDKINDLYDHCCEREIPFFVTTSSGAEEIELWCKRTGAEYPVYFTDGNALKRMIRANPGMILLKDGVIVGKWDVSDLPAVEKFADSATGLPDQDSVWVERVRGWRFWMLLLAIPLILFSLLDYLLAKLAAKKLRNAVSVAEPGEAASDAGEVVPENEQDNNDTNINNH